MVGEQGGEYSVVLNGISAVCLTAKVKTCSEWETWGVWKEGGIMGHLCSQRR